MEYQDNPARKVKELIIFDLFTSLNLTPRSWQSFTLEVQLYRLCDYAYSVKPVAEICIEACWFFLLLVVAESMYF